MEPKLSVELNVRFQPFNELRGEKTIPLAPSIPVESEPIAAQPGYPPSDSVISRVVPFTPSTKQYE